MFRRTSNSSIVCTFPLAKHNEFIARVLRVHSARKLSIRDRNVHVFFFEIEHFHALMGHEFLFPPAEERCWGRVSENLPTSTIFLQARLPNISRDKSGWKSQLTFPDAEQRLAEPLNCSRTRDNNNINVYRNNRQRI